MCLIRDAQNARPRSRDKRLELTRFGEHFVTTEHRPHITTALARSSRGYQTPQALSTASYRSWSCRDVVATARRRRPDAGINL
jgi:hypothetical protein